MIIAIFTAAIAVWIGIVSMRRKRWPAGLLVIGIAVLSIGIIGCSSTAGKADTTAKTSISYKIKHQTVRVGASRLAAAKLESKTLADRATKQDAEYASVKSASSSATAASKRAASSSAVRAASAKRAASSSVARARAAASKSASARKSAATRQSSTHRAAATTGRTVTNRGDMNTGNSKRIVGNKNSKIYHVPGQAGYRMNSANAVYFASEAAAKAAGYRKALR